MTRNDKFKIQRGSVRRGFWRRLASGAYGVTDLPRKLPFIVLYLLGAVWVAGKQADAKAFAETVTLPSPVMLAIFHHLLLFYLVVGAVRCWCCCFIPWTGRPRRKNSSGSA